MSHLIYVAHPIDHVGDLSDRVTRVLLEAEVAIRVAGHTAYWPRKGWQFGDGENWEAVHEINVACQRQCTALLAILIHGVPTLGVPVEIEKALAWGQPVVMVVDLETTAGVQVMDWQRRGATLAFDVPTGLRALKEVQKPTNGQEGASPWPQLGELRVQSGSGQLPTRTYAGDAGFDLVCSESRRIDVGQFVDLNVECAMEFPPGVWGWIVGRSSTLRNKRLLVNQGIIDHGYRGELFVGVQNVGDKAVRVTNGERVAQLIPMPLLAPQLAVRKVAVLGWSDRGANGFGSTGV